MLPTPDRRRIAERLCHVLDLARRPGTTGEADAAIQAAGRLVLHNPWLTTSVSENVAMPVATKPARDWHEAVRRCAEQPHLLNTWERDFVHSLAQRHVLSSKQAAVLHRIAGRLGCNWTYP